MRPDQLHTLFDYFPDTSKLVWKVDHGPNKVKGKEAGSINQLGYVYVKLNNKLYLAHRIAWAIVHGEWPQYSIDHIDGVRHHNMISNLRQVSHSENGANRKVNTNNTSGAKGVYRSKGKWYACIKVNQQQKHLGVFDSFDEAVKARRNAETKFFAEYAGG